MVEISDLDVNMYNSHIDRAMAAAREKYASLRRHAPNGPRTGLHKTQTEDFCHRHAVVIVTAERLIVEAQAQLDAPIQAPITHTPAERLEEADEEEWSISYRRSNRFVNRMAVENWKGFHDVLKVVEERSVEQQQHQNPPNSKALQPGRRLVCMPSTGWSSHIPEDLQVWALTSKQRFKEYHDEDANKKPTEIAADSEGDLSHAGVRYDQRAWNTNAPAESQEARVVLETARTHRYPSGKPDVHPVKPPWERDREAWEVLASWEVEITR